MLTEREIRDESNRIYRRFIWYTFVLVASIITLANPDTFWNTWIFTIAAGAFVVSLVAIALNIIMVSRLPDLDNDEPQPPNATDLPTFNQDTEPQTRLATRDPHQPSRIIIAGQLVSRRQWRKLCAALRHHKRFTRDVLAESGAFNSLTKNYKHIHGEFVKLGWVVGNEITPSGWAALESAEVPPTLETV